MADQQPRPLVVLVGPPGSGKSAVASLLARRLGVAHRDTDDEVAAQAGRSVPQIFADEGEAAFRERETLALRQELHRDAGVLSLGGGAPVPERNQKLLRDYAAAGGTVVFLDVSVDTAVARIGDVHGRPLLDGDPRGQLTALMSARRAVYENVAQVHLDTSALTLEQVVETVAWRLAPGAPPVDLAGRHPHHVTGTEGV